MGNNSRAAPLLSEAVSNSVEHIDQTASILTESKQLAYSASFVERVDSYVSAVRRLDSTKADKNNEQLCSIVLRWKGNSLVRQRAARLLAGQDNPDLQKLFSELQSTTSRWATLRKQVVDPRKPKKLSRHREHLTELKRRKQELESQLSQKSKLFSQANQRITLESLKRVLPSDTAVVDYLQYNDWEWDAEKKEWNSTPSLVAFVIRSDSSVQVEFLGPVEPVDVAIDTWRSPPENDGVAFLGMGAKARSAGFALRQRIWDPLEEHLEDATTILLCTDGVLGRFPIGALPGKRPDTYLVHDYRLAMVPVPRLIPQLLEETDVGVKPEYDMLLLGGVDYDRSDQEPGSNQSPSDSPESFTSQKSTQLTSSRSVATIKGKAHWDRLDETRREIDAVRSLFVANNPKKQKIVEFRDAKGTEAAIRETAPKCRLMHLATHGFFADEDRVSARIADKNVSPNDHSTRIEGYNAGLLSGLVFAGANQPPELGDDAWQQVTIPDDGIMTANEIAFLPLQNVDLAVLSACETGLGKVAGGEGLLGIQRAFQVSGVRTTVATLWKVDDAQTRKMMESFYSNLWEKQMSKLDALRNAQLSAIKDRSYPEHWAAFVLSGDWR